jgi:aspartyl-tRNA(Asn)/glutamyl-tRNA(Gln) amidotransferase subunit C
MSVDKETVRRIARLARIDEPEGDLAPLAAELSRILTWVEQLGEVDTDHVAPMTSAVQSKLPRRDDVVSDGGYADDIVKNAPNTQDHFFRVPKVVE